MVNPKDVTGKVVNKIHRTLFRASNGRIGGNVMGMPAVELVTVGRKSGQRRSTMLTAPIIDDDRVVLVASWGGDDRHPLWYLNLRDEPKVEVTVNGRHRDMTARTATAVEKADLWPIITRSYKGYAGYQQKTDREIPVVILEPR